MVTMRSLEQRPWREDGASALEERYRSVRDIPLDDLPVRDVARSLRQRLFPDFMVPVAIRLLRENGLAGDLYAGELLVSLRSLDENFWNRRDELMRELARVLSTIDTAELDADLIADINAIGSLVYPRV